MIYRNKALILAFGLVPFAILFAWPKSSEAALVIDVRDAVIGPGQTGFLDVYVSSTGTNIVGTANYMFQIGNIGSPASALELINPQTLSANGQPDYLFASDLDPLGLFIFSQTASEIEVGDFSASGNGVTVDSMSRLLFRFDLQHVLGPGQSADQAIGDQFSLTLLPGAGTFFLDESGVDIAIDPSSRLSGFVTVNATAVPEPGITGLMLMAGVVGGWRMRRKRLQQPGVGVDKEAVGVT